MVEVWLTKKEKNDPAIRESLKPIYAHYKKKKCLVAVYESGEGDLYESTSRLLTYNKKRLAELTIQSEANQRQCG